MTTRTVTGTYLNIDGTPVKGYLEFTPSSALALDAVIPVSVVRVVLDETGAFTCELQVTDDPLMIPTGWKWSVEEKIPNGNQWYLDVPTSASPLDISDAYIIGSNGGPFYGIQGPVGPQSTVPGPPGPANSLGIGTVVDGGVAEATITGDSPNQTLNLVLPNGPQGIPGPTAVSTDANNLAEIGTDSLLYVPNNQGGADEVAVGTAEPTDPNTQLWVETDAVPVPKMRYRVDSVSPWNEVGGSDEVAISDTEPAQAGIKLWVDTDAVSLSPSGYGNTYNFRNKIINGDFSINQRGFSSTTGDGVYGFDRWVIYRAAGGTTTYSAATTTLNELPEAAQNVARVVTTGQAAAGDFSILQQRIESVKTLSGKKATISFWAKGTAGLKVAVEFAQAFGTGGTPSAEVDTYVGKITLSATWARYSLTVDVPSLSGKTIGTNGDNSLSISLWLSAGSNWNARTGSLGIQSGTFDFWGVQVEEGSRATPFEKKSYADELRACQRYYYTILQPNETTLYLSLMHSYAESTTQFKSHVDFVVPMRIAPSLVYTAGNHTSYSLGYPGSFPLTSLVVEVASIRRVLLTGLVASGLTNSYSYMLYRPGTVNSIAFSAEL